MAQVIGEEEPDWAPAEDAGEEAQVHSMTLPPAEVRSLMPVPHRSDPLLAAGRCAGGDG